MDINRHLAECLTTHKMRHIKNVVDAFNEKASEIIEKLTKNYGQATYGIFKSGSFAKHTAINTKFDIDLVVPFKYSRFKTLEEMYDDVHNFLEKEYKNKAVVRRQKVSIGVEFPTHIDNFPIKFDIVPGRELNEGDYCNTHDLNLYFNESHWGFSKGSRQKTNIYKQIKHIEGKTDERSIIRLLKIWKYSLKKDYKSFIIELFTIKAMSYYTGENVLWQKLKHVMSYINQNVNNDGFQLIDPGNSNNNVLSSMSPTQRILLANDMKTIIDNVSTEHKNATYYFPINDKFKSKDDNFYKQKQTSGPSYPPTGQRFGK